MGESTVVGRAVALDPGRRSSFVDEHDEVAEIPALGGEAPQPRPPAAPRLRLGPPMPTDRLRGWVVTLTLTLIAGVVRFVGLDRPTDGGTPVFDEKHYVPQAWQMLRNGGVEDNPGYELIVHPPLGKQLIAMGELLLGYNGWGWRAASALAGTIAVLLVIRVARRLTRSTLLGAVAGVLLICDGLSHVQSRMGMLDVFGALFTLAAFATLICDRDDVRARLAVVLAEGRIGDSPYGPRLGVRWWRFATGVLLGLGCAVKWSGVYWLAAFAVLTLVFDATARRASGVRRPWVGTIVRDVAPAVWVLALLPVLVYVGSWWAWFRSETGIDRNVVGLDRGANGIGPDGPWAFVPDALRSLWFFSAHVLDFHAGLTTTSSGQHPWESKPWTWPMGLRPMLYYYASGEKVTGCGTGECISAVMLIGTPALVVVGDPGAGVGVVAGGGPVRLALRRRSRRLRRGHPAVAGQHRPPDVLLLHGAGRAVPGARDDAGDGPDPWPGRRPVGAPADRARGRGAVGRARGGELRLPVAHPRRGADHPGGVGRAAVAAVVAPLIIRSGSQPPRRAARSPSAPAPPPSAAARSAARAARTGPAAPRRPGRATPAPR